MYIKFVYLESPMTHAKFQDNRTLGSVARFTERLITYLSPKTYLTTHLRPKTCLILKICIKTCHKSILTVN